MGTANPAHPAGETRGWVALVSSKPAAETRGWASSRAGLPSAEASNKKEGRSIVYSPPGWYDNAPTLSRRGCAALKAAGLRPATRKLFEKSLRKNV